MSNTLSLPDRITQAQREIREDVSVGRFDADDISCFADLHDFVDANEYGGLTAATECDDCRLHLEHDNCDVQLSGDQLIEVAATVQNAVDTWLRNGGLHADVPYRVTVHVPAGVAETSTGPREHDGYPDYTTIVRAPRAGLAQTRAMIDYPHSLRGEAVTYTVEELDPYDISDCCNAFKTFAEDGTLCCKVCWHEA